MNIGLLLFEGTSSKLPMTVHRGVGPTAGRNLNAPGTTQGTRVLPTYSKSMGFVSIKKRHINMNRILILSPSRAWKM